MFETRVMKEANVTHVMDNNAVVGVLGTAVSVLLTNISVIVSIVVGILTAWYMIEKAITIRDKRNRDIELHEKELEDNT